MVAIIIWLATLIVSVIFTIIFNEPIQRLLAWSLPQIVPRKYRSLVGIWETTFEYNVEGIEHKNTHLFEIKQFANFIYGKNITPGQNGCWYRIQGKIDANIYVTGIWFSAEGSDIHHGAIQFVIATDGKTMEGMWIGFNRHHHVQPGPWQWRKLSDHLNDKKELIKKHKTTS
jgi:hypothetical protein